MVALPGKLLVIVLPGPGDAGATVTAFGRSAVADLNVKTAVVQGARLEAANVGRPSHRRLPRLRPGGRQLARGPPRALHPTPARRPVGRDGRRLRQRGARRRPRAVRPVRRGGGPPQRLPRRGGLRPRLRRAHRRRLRLAAVAAGLPRAQRRCRHRRASSPRAAPADELEAATRSMLARVLDDTSLVGDAWSSPTGTAARRAAAGRRLVIQRSRARGDGELVPLAHAAVARWAAHAPDAAPVAEVLGTWGAPDRAGPRRRIAVVTPDTLAPRMAGPGIRALQIARRLAADHEVVLATTERCELQETGFEAIHVGEKGLRDLERWCDVFLFQGWVMAGRDYLGATDKVVIADVYDPMHLEQLEQGHDAEGERGRFDAVRNASTVLNDQLARADFMLCASTKQRDLWLGQLAGLGPHQPRRLRRRRVAALPAGGRALRGGRPTARGDAPRDPRRHPGHRPGRPRDPLGRRGLQLVRPAHAGAGHRPPPAAAPDRSAPVPRHAAPQPGDPGDADGRRDPAPGGGARPGRPARVLQPRRGSTSRTGRTTCSMPTSASAPTSTTSRRSSPSAPGSSTTSGPGCRSSPPTATRSPR